jgi:hypothetical protein
VSDRIGFTFQMRFHRSTHAQVICIAMDAALLNRVREFVREQVITGVSSRIVIAVIENDVVANRISFRIHRARGLSCR